MLLRRRRKRRTGQAVEPEKLLLVWQWVRELVRLGLAERHANGDERQLRQVCPQAVLDAILADPSAWSARVGADVETTLLPGPGVHWTVCERLADGRRLHAQLSARGEDYQIEWARVAAAPRVVEAREQVPLPARLFDPRRS